MISCIDLFCGAGGLTRGLLDAGIRVVRGVDTDGGAKETYERNNRGSVFMHANLRGVSADEIMAGVDRSRSDFLLAGCAPCQPFSKHSMGSNNDGRRSLVRCMARLVKETLPEYVLMENVPEFENESNVHRTYFIRVLKRNGYAVDDGVVNAVEYGVPQTRRRYLILASRKGKIKIPAGRYSNGNSRTVRDAIYDFPKLEAGENHASLPNHTAPTLSSKNLERMKLTPPDGGSRRNIPRRLWINSHKKHKGHTDTYGRMRWDKPAPTLTCRCTSISNGRFGHPTQHRAISVREAAALQTFPDDYIFYSHKTRNTVHIGNAVPVRMAMEIGKAIFRFSVAQA